MKKELKETYLIEMRKLHEEDQRIRKNKKLLLKKYVEAINKDYEHLLNKKVEITYTVSGKDGYQRDIAYWGGYNVLDDFDFIEIPMLYKVKSNGQISSIRHRLKEGWSEIIDIKEVE